MSIVNTCPRGSMAESGREFMSKSNPSEIESVRLLSCHPLKGDGTGKSSRERRRKNLIKISSSFHIRYFFFFIF